MKKLLIFALVTVLITFIHTSCKFAPKEELGDTVAASVFEPYDTTMAGKRKAGQEFYTLPSGDSIVTRIEEIKQ